jgi:hypothetical protein
VNNSGATNVGVNVKIEFPSGMSGRATREHHPLITNIVAEHAMITCRLIGSAGSVPAPNEYSR